MFNQGSANAWIEKDMHSTSTDCLGHSRGILYYAVLMKSVIEKISRIRIPIVVVVVLLLLVLLVLLLLVFVVVFVVFCCCCCYGGYVSGGGVDCGFAILLLLLLVLSLILLLIFKTNKKIYWKYKIRIVRLFLIS